MIDRYMGPIIDCICLLGKYIYIETSFPSVNGDRAQLRSRWIDPSCKPCKLNFWYHMYGTTTNKLNVYMKPRSGSMTTLWTKSGDQGNQWLQANVDLVSGVSYRIIFEAVAGTSYTGDIAIDDITLTSCPPVPTPSPPPPCSPSTTPRMLHLGVRLVILCVFVRTGSRRL